uniref:MFS transporter n=1 Tax=Phenylobacterium glaciei TaxID=2803784 RepID=A0A974S9X7_9CAUL|nr:MFS transporter [Phenylobacterium glaciei]
MGRYRVWTLLGAPILMAGIYFLFLPPESATRNYLIAWLLIMYLGNSILALSHAAWASTLAPHYDDRSRLFGIITGLGVLGAAAILAIPIINDARQASDAGNVETMGWFIFALIPLAVAAVVWRTPEKIAPEIEGHSFRLRDYGALITRPSFARILLADLCLALGPGWMSALYLFFFTDSRGFTTGQASILLAVYILAGFAGAPLMGRLATKISKHRAVMVATTVYSLVLISLMAIPQGNMLIGAIPMFMAGFMAAGFNVLTRAMTADVADEVRLEQGKERSGLLFAMTVMTAKIAGAVSIGLTFFVLDKVGYLAKEGRPTPRGDPTPGACLSDRARDLRDVGGACMIGYKLGAERHAEIRRDLDARDALYDSAPILESVTGEAANVSLSKD